MKPTCLLLPLLLAGCAALAPQPPHVDTVTTTFAIPGHMAERGTVLVQSPDPALNPSLEFAYYRQRFEEKLQEQGYQIETDLKKARYVAFVTYGVDNGQAETVTMPVYGQVGGGPVVTTGTVVTGSGKVVPYTGTGYVMPRFGVVGTSTDTVIRYTRVIAMDIVETASLKTATPRRIYETRAKSTGGCGNFIDVFEPILNGMFQQWPGVPGKSQLSEVSWNGRCTGR